MGLLSVIKAVPSTVVKGTAKAMFRLKTAKPQILVGGGIAIATGAFVIAIVNARKIDTTMAVSNAKVDELEGKRNDISASVNLSEDEKKEKLREVEKELNKAKAEGIWKMFQLIGVPTLMFVGGVSMTIGGHVILVKRFGQLSAGFAALQDSYNRYRQMNIAEHGEECDRRYIYGVTGSETVLDKITDENGKEKTVKSKVPVVDENGQKSLYTFVFSEEFSRACPRDPVNTICFLQSQEKYWNTYMKSSHKPVTLAMILEDLRIELDPDDPANDYIYLAGWRPNGDGDNHIDFGIMRAINKKTIDQQENVVMLNFNCDGNIYHSARYDKQGRKIC